MPVRDAEAVEAVLAARPYPGYAIHRRRVLAADTERIAACVALLGTMLLGGVALGTRTGR